MITTDRKGTGPRMPAELAKAVYEPDLGGRTIGDLVTAQGRATAETLAKNGCPVRTFAVERLNEPAIGYLMMHFMLETIIAADLLGVDAFDQPAVEEGKILAKRLRNRSVGAESAENDMLRAPTRISGLRPP